MASCCPNFFKVPHLTNRCHRERILQFFLRTFIFVNFIINTVILSASAVVRAKLGLPFSCTGLTENVYMSTYTLFAVAVFSYICMFLTCVKSRRVKSSKHLTGHVVVFLIIVVAELFITILSITQSNRIPEVLSDNTHIFNSGNCLVEVESRHRCCGFQNFTEWPAHLTTSEDAKHFTFQYEQRDHGNSTLLHNTTQLSTVDVFSRSCQCVASTSTKCVTVNYTLSFSNSTNDTISWDSHSTVDSNSTSSQTIAGSVTIHSTPCYSKIRSQLKDMYMAIGLISVLAFVAQLVVFGFHFYLTHNLEGAAAVSDIYRPSADSYGQYSHGRPAKVTFLDLSVIQAVSQDEVRGHRRSFNATSEGSVATAKAAMTNVSLTELENDVESVRLGDASPKELKELDGSLRFSDASPKELKELDGSLRFSDASPKELKELDGSLRFSDASPKEVKDVDRSLRVGDVSPKELKDLNGYVRLDGVSLKELKDVDRSVRLGGVAVVQSSKCINITF